MTAVLLTALLVAGCSSETQPAKPSTSATPAGPVQLTFAVYGPPQVITAYTKLAAEFSAAHPGVAVNVQPYDTHAQAMRGLAEAREKGDPPDLFLMDQDDLPRLSGERALRRVDDLMAQRQIDFGDGYTRAGLEAFSADSALQCMPADVSPLVVYYNPRLVNLSAAVEPDANPVDANRGWNLEEFARVAADARRPGVRGFDIAPDLDQIAPFILSGGGELVDNLDEPTTLTLSDDGSADALEQLLELVRDPTLTFGQKALRRKPALERFKDGQLGMILGYRDLVPQLRAQNDFFFDVMPLPRLGSGATVSSMRGLCIASGSEHKSKAADFLSALVSDEGARALAATGYVMPANLQVLTSDAFLQREQQPVNSQVFVKRVRDIEPQPESAQWPAIRAATRPALVDLFYQPVILPLQQRLEAIDEASRPIFDPSLATPGAPAATPSHRRTTTP